MMWELHASYHASRYPSLDYRIVEALRAADIKQSYESGLGFGTRDLWFRFRREAQAKNAHRILKAIPNVKTELSKAWSVD